MKSHLETFTWQVGNFEIGRINTTSLSLFMPFWQVDSIHPNCINRSFWIIMLHISAQGFDSMGCPPLSYKPQRSVGSPFTVPRAFFSAFFINSYLQYNLRLNCIFLAVTDPQIYSLLCYSICFSVASNFRYIHRKLTGLALQWPTLILYKVLGFDQD